MIREHTENSLKRLGIERLDLTQLHCVPMEQLKRAEVWETLRVLKKDGKIARFGNITIVGNQSVGDHIIERQLTFKPGELFRRSLMQDSQRRLSGTGSRWTGRSRTGATRSAGYCPRRVISRGSSSSMSSRSWSRRARRCRRSSSGG